MYYFSKMKSPLGLLYLVSNGKSLISISFHSNWITNKNNLDAPLKKGRTCKILIQTEKQLNEYFQKKRTLFTIPLQMNGTKFQNKVWNALKWIPYGKTSTYKKISILIKHPKAFRALGSANGANPIPIIVPCHRIINESGKLGGYSGGLKNKKLLLDLEKEKKHTD